MHSILRFLGFFFTPPAYGRCLMYRYPEPEQSLEKDWMKVLDGFDKSKNRHALVNKKKYAKNKKKHQSSQ